MLLFLGALTVIVLGLHQSVIAQVMTEDETLDVSAVVPGATSPSQGGGSGSQAQQATVILSGNTFPNAKLTLLKDGQVTTTLLAQTDGSFQITINSLSFGNYQFSIIAEDITGVVASPYTVNVPAFSTQPYTYSNIVLPPTITVSTTLVKIGQSFTVSGYAPPNATVNLEIPNAASLGSAVAGPDGKYTITVTASLPANIYSLRTKAIFNGITSPYSKPVQVLYYLIEPGQSLPPPPVEYQACVDYNHDRHSNLVDFSILLFWFGKANPPKTIDCNGDNAIDIKDFSILMYFWTG